MNINPKFKKILSLLVCICFSFSFFVTKTFASNDNATGNQKIVQKDKNIVKVVGEYNGDKLYATLDRKTNIITMEAVEKSADGLEKTTQYTVNIDDAQPGSKISGQIVSKKDNKKYKIDSGKVKAQAVVVVPLVEIIGSALLEYLMAISATIVLSGIVFVAANEIADTLKEDGTYEYYEAKQANGTIYIGRGLNYKAAYNRVVYGSTYNKDVFCLEQDPAYTLAVGVSKYSVSYRSYECHDEDSPYYFWHYHPNPRNGGHIYFFF